MNLYNFLLLAVQITAIATFLIFMGMVFMPKILEKKSRFRKYFFHDKKIIKDFLILTSFYIFLFAHLFYFNENKSSLWLYLPGFVLAVSGLLIAMIGRLQLRKLWNPLTNIYDSQELLDKGVFGFFRHPIYLGRFTFFLGVVLMLNLFAVLMTPFYWDYLRNRLILEEKYLSEINPAYKNYMQKVKRIIF